MEIFFTKSWLRVLSGLLTNLAAAWFGVAFITPILANVSPPLFIFTLTKEIIFGTMFLLAAVKIEGELEKWTL